MNAFETLGSDRYTEVVGVAISQLARSERFVVDSCTDDGLMVRHWSSDEPFCLIEPEPDCWRERGFSIRDPDALRLCEQAWAITLGARRAALTPTIRVRRREGLIEGGLLR